MKAANTGTTTSTSTTAATGTGVSENPQSASAPISNPSQSQTDPTTPGTPTADSIAPEPPKKVSAKENRKNQDSRIQEAVAHRAANSTAAMMMGLGGPFGGKKKKKVYAWMTSGSGAGGGGAASGGGGSGGGAIAPSSPSRANSDLQTPGGDVVSVWGRRIGEWREDGEKGLGVQIRDWAGALEGDGRERRAVVKAYLRMK